MPPGVTLESGRLRARFQGCFPLDPTNPSSTDAMNMSFQFRIKGATGTSMEGVAIEVKAEVKRKSVWRALGNNVSR